MEIQLITREYRDVIVVGGGIAGVCAAISAARRGADVLLIEKSVNLGGLATSGLISWYEPLCDGKGEQVIGTMAEELLKLAVEFGFDNLPTRWGGCGKNKPKNERYSTFYSPTLFSMALDEFVTESGVKILFDTLATYPVMEGTHCTGVIAENANGREFYPCGAVIDATGDASIFHRAGAPTAEGENFMTYIVHEMDVESARTCGEDGNLAAFRRWKNCGSDLAGNGHPAGMKRFHGTTAEEITEYMLIGKAMMLSRYKDTDKNSREVLSVPSMPQLRTVRHICSENVFDTSIGNADIADPIGTVGDFRYSGKRYKLPYSSMWCKPFDNLLAAGRIIGVADADSWEVARVIPVCALTGETAGAAAWLSLKSGVPVWNAFKA